jgi:hypothetical protein
MPLFLKNDVKIGSFDTYKPANSKSSDSTKYKQSLSAVPGGSAVAVQLDSLYAKKPAGMLFPLIIFYSPFKVFIYCFAPVLLSCALVPLACIISQSGCC